MSTIEEREFVRPVGQPLVRAMRRVLVCLDRSRTSEGCLPVATALAKGYGSELTLLHVLEGGSTARETAAPDATGWFLARSEAEEYLSGIVGVLSARRLRGRARVLEGHAAEQILCFADREDVDLIVLCSHGERGVGEWSLGSTAEKVLARARTSVLVARAAPRRKDQASLQNVLVPLDGSARAERVLPPLERLAREERASLVLLHATAPLELFEAAPPLQVADAVRRLEDRNARMARSYLAQVRARLAGDGCSARELVERGDLRSVLPGVVERERIDLVAITSHGRTGDRARRYGDVASHLLRKAAVPVLMLPSLPQRASEYARAVRHRREAAPLRGTHTLES